MRRSCGASRADLGTSASDFVYHERAADSSLLPRRAPQASGARREEAGAAARSRRQLHVGRNLRHDGRARRGARTRSRGHRDRSVVRPACGRRARAAGVGAEVTSSREQVAMPPHRHAKSAAASDGRVRALQTANIRSAARPTRASAASMGRTALLDTGRARRRDYRAHARAVDLGVFKCVGLDPRACRFSS